MPRDPHFVPVRVPRPSDWPHVLRSLSDEQLSRLAAIIEYCKARNIWADPSRIIEALRDPISTMNRRQSVRTQKEQDELDEMEYEATLVSREELEARHGREKVACLYGEDFRYDDSPSIKRRRLGKGRTRS